jgi:hypothetical protein
MLETNVQNNVLPFVYRVTVLANYSYSIGVLLGFESALSKRKAQCVKQFHIAHRFESTGIYPFNRNTRPAYLLSTFAGSETTFSMVTAPPNVTLLLCNLYFVNQPSKCATYCSRNFINYSEYFTSI